MMKFISFKYSAVIIILLLVSISVAGQSFTKEGAVSRTFALEDDTEIQISNKYGDITIENWEKDSVKIEILYSVASNKQSKLDPIYDAINFDFKANKYYVVVKTVFEGRGSFWFDVSEIANNIFAAGTHTSIDYVIYLPESSHLSINLKYGNIYMMNQTGFFNLFLSNGNLKAHSFYGGTKLDIEYGDAAIKDVLVASAKVRYGSLDLQSADELTLIGQSSEFDFGIINNLAIDSKRDKISIEKVNILTGSTYFSKLFIDEVTDNINLSTKYGSFMLEKITSDVKNIQLTSYNTSLSLYFQKGNNYYISLISDNKADVAYSSKLGEFVVKELPDKLKHAVCVYGNEKEAIPVSVDIESGMLTFKVHE